GIGPFADRLRERLTRGETEEDRINQFLIQEGVAAVIRASSLDYGLIDAKQLPYNKIGDMKPVPHFIIGQEQHARMMRMIDKGISPKLRVQLKVSFYTDPKYHVNILGEIPGTDHQLKDQIVLVGGHFDSYHSGTGAADNGAGCATIMEAMRILKVIGVKPRRTIRIALWDGEEQGLKGSLGYIKKYVGDILEGTKKQEQSKISVYFNHDNNGHNIRGIFLQGNEAIRPIFEEYFKPFHYIGARTVTIENACCTDHRGFDAMNIPAFEWIQDPMNYFTHQIHTSMDVVDLVTENSLKRNAVIIATFVYHAAMRDEMMPRKRIN
ncbi:MAG: M20/M25/M40 family metallo-hydrolase, partial [bacterium]